MNILNWGWSYPVGLYSPLLTHSICVERLQISKTEQSRNNSMCNNLAIVNNWITTTIHCCPPKKEEIMWSLSNSADWVADRNGPAEWPTAPKSSVLAIELTSLCAAEDKCWWETTEGINISSVSMSVGSSPPKVGSPTRGVWSEGSLEFSMFTCRGIGTPGGKSDETRSLSNAAAVRWLVALLVVTAGSVCTIGTEPTDVPRRLAMPSIPSSASCWVAGFRDRVGYRWTSACISSSYDRFCTVNVIYITIRYYIHYPWLSRQSTLQPWGWQLSYMENCDKHGVGLFGHNVIFLQGMQRNLTYERMQRHTRTHKCERILLIAM